MRAMIFFLRCLPSALLKYHTILTAVSFASEPELLKNTFDICTGIKAISRSASSTAMSCDLLVEDVVVGQALHLASRRLDQPLLAETERRAPQARQAFDVFLAVLVIDMDALALGDDERPLALMLLEMRVGMKIVGDVAAGGGIASLHGGVLELGRFATIRRRTRASQTTMAVWQACVRAPP